MNRSAFVVPAIAAVLVAARPALADTCNGAVNNLVRNCGFETGTFAGWIGSNTQNNYSGIDSGDPLTSFQTPYQGNYEAYLGTVFQSGTLTQTLNTTPGQQYQIQFALLNDTAPTSNYGNLFQAVFGSTTLYDQTNLAMGDWQLFSFMTTASTDSTQLLFTSQNRLGSFEFDSVSVTPIGMVSPVPEPTSLALLGTGVLMVFPWKRSRRTQH